VYGPHERRHRREGNDEEATINCQYSQTTFAQPGRRQRPRGDRRGNNYGNQLEMTFESVILRKAYPRSQIDIFCEVLEVGFGIAGKWPGILINFKCFFRRTAAVLHRASTQRPLPWRTRALP
jgi:hypothetical protein